MSKVAGCVATHPQGTAAAQYGLGILYDYGQGVSDDYLPAYAWYNLPAAPYWGSRVPPKRCKAI